MLFCNSCFFYDPMDVGNLTSCSSAFSKSSLNIWKFTVHILLHFRLRGRQRQADFLPRVRTASERRPGVLSLLPSCLWGAPLPPLHRAALTQAVSSGCWPFPWARELDGTSKYRKPGSLLLTSSLRSLIPSAEFPKCNGLDIHLAETVWLPSRKKT